MTVGLGTWGFTLLVESKKGLDFFQSIDSALNLFGLSLGQGGGVGVKLPWQIVVAAVLAAALTARAVLALTGDRIRRWYIRRRLRGHLIVCGAGAIGGQLADDLDRQRLDVVVIDLNPDAVGLAPAPGRYIWSLQGDATLRDTLLNAGIRSAAELFAVTSDDYVNSRIVTAVHELRIPRLRVHVRIEDPGLTRFFEERVGLDHASDGDELAQVPRGPGGLSAAGELPEVSPFSINAVAARTLLIGNPSDSRSGGPRKREGVRLELVDGMAPHLLLAGDHPMLEAVTLEAVRRWRTLGHELGQKPRPPPLRVSFYGRDAVARAERFRNRWAPDPKALDLYSQDLPATGHGAEESDEGLMKLRGRKARGGRPGDYVSHAIVACEDELEGIALALGVGRALGDGVSVVRISMEQRKSTLDDHIERHTRASHYRATTQVLPLAELACRDDAIRSHASGPDRLLDELVRRDVDRKFAPISVETLYAHSDLDIHTDPAWQLSKTEAAMLEALLEGVAKDDGARVPLDAVVTAGLAINLHTGPNLLAALTRLIVTERGEEAFAASCEYARLTLKRDDLDRAITQLGVLETKGTDPEEARALAIRVLQLRRDALTAAAVGPPRPDDKPDQHEGGVGKQAGRGDLLAGYSRVAIFAGGADTMSVALLERLPELLGPRKALVDGEHDQATSTEAAIAAPPGSKLLPRSKRPQALQKFDGVVLCTGTGSGLSRVVAEAANGYRVNTVGYVPKHWRDALLYPDLRRTDGTDFSVREPLAMWTDILAAGISPDGVAVVAFPSAERDRPEALPISHAEILLARALGAKVGWIDPANEAPLPLRDVLPGGNEDILELPTDAMSIRALIYGTELDDKGLREHVAKQAHAEYRTKQLERKPRDDPALAPWERLLPLFQDSNRGQADDIKNKLAMIGLRLLPKREGGSKLALEPEEVELLAEMEHGRYVVERLRAGWQKGDRDTARRVTPYVKPWDDLGKEQEYDREAVREIAGAIDSFGYGVAELEDSGIGRIRGIGWRRRLGRFVALARTSAL